MLFYKVLSGEEINRALFRHFIRRQKVTKCWRKVGGVWCVQDVAFIDDWTEEDYAELVRCLHNTVETGGLVMGAFVHEELKGFVSVESGLFGSNR